MTPTPVAEAARSLHLPLAEVATVKSGGGLDAIRAAEPDVLAVVAYGEILPATVLGLPVVAPVNLHFSLLPELRGAAPVQRAILDGLAVTGVTTIRMDEGMDTGPILLQAAEPILEEDDAGSLGERLAGIGARVLVDTLDRLEEGELVEREQDHSRATMAPKLSAADRVIDWSRPAEAIVRQVRALSPTPGAESRFRGKVLKVFRTSRRTVRFTPPPTRSPEQWPNGSVVASEEGSFGVRVPEGVIHVEEVALEGRRRMTGEEFVRGHRPAGEVLG
jgi:methionyl-tRNA formyltransferase